MKPRALYPYPNGWFAAALSAKLRHGQVITRPFMEQDAPLYRTTSASRSTQRDSSAAAVTMASNGIRAMQPAHAGFVPVLPTDNRAVVAPDDHPLLLQVALQPLDKGAILAAVGNEDMAHGSQFKVSGLLWGHGQVLLTLSIPKSTLHATCPACCVKTA